MKRLWFMLAFGSLLGAALFTVAGSGDRAGRAHGAALAAGNWVSAVAGQPAAGFEPPSGEWELSLPEDHAPHSRSRTEAWQFTSQLRGKNGQWLGLQFSLFRVGLTPPGTSPATDWDAREIYRGHIVLLGDDGTVLAEERFGRGMAGLAGYDRNLRELRIDSWTIDFDAGTGPRWRLAALAGNFDIDLILTPVKQAANSGAAAVPFRAYSFSRLAVEGTISTPDERRTVAGTGWFDHLWGELPVPGEAPVVSDRMQLQLDDGTDISLMRSRRIDGAGSPAVDLTVIDPSGEVTLIGSEATAGLARSWQQAGATMAKDWRLTIDDLDLSLKPLAPAREHDFITPLWSGLVSAEGLRGGLPVRGTGTLQLTGHGLR